jgi:hypothetical protein
MYGAGDRLRADEERRLLRACGPRRHAQRESRRACAGCTRACAQVEGVKHLPALAHGRVAGVRGERVIGRGRCIVDWIEQECVGWRRAVGCQRARPVMCSNTCRSMSVKPSSATVRINQARMRAR